MTVTREQILAAFNEISGDPSCGIVHDIQPAFADAVVRLLNPEPEAKAGKTEAQARETR